MPSYGKVKTNALCLSVMYPLYIQYAAKKKLRIYVLHETFNKFKNATSTLQTEQFYQIKLI